tara:strand:+ start:308 stop:523 length:216 start_codon:yes stop_codon:yes gene_type:complete
MTYHSKGVLFDEVMYKLAREIYKSRSNGTSKESVESWEETFLKHSEITLDEYIKYAKLNNLKDKYINVKKV